MTADTAALAKSYASTASMSTLTEMSDGQVEEMNREMHTMDLSDLQVNLVNERPLFDEQTELDGCRKILQALTAEERRDLADANMPLRHFRAEKGDVDLAIEKIKSTLAWRRDFGVDRIVGCFEDGGDEEMRRVIERENVTGKICVRGYDRKGRAVMYMTPGLENTRDEVDQMRHLVYNLERAIACTKRTSGKEKICIVINFKGWKLRNSPPLSTTLYTLDILQKHYCERMYRGYVADPPVVFRTFWNLIRSFVDPVTKEKIVFCHGKEGLRKLEEDFDLETTERCAGGTRDLRPHDVEEYLHAPIDCTFDENPVAAGSKSVDDGWVYMRSSSFLTGSF